MITAVFVLDTSYLLELFRVPGHSNDAAVTEIRNRYGKAIKNNSRLYVPLPCIFELANHIADVNDGHSRRELGNKFFETIKSCVKENIPWIITPSCDMEILTQLCEVFAVRYLLKTIDLTDTNTILESQRLKKKYSSFSYNVHIWTKDSNLKAYEPDHEIDSFTG